MSYRKYDIWSKELPDGRVVEYLYGTLFQARGKRKSWAGAKVSGVVLKPIQNLDAGLTRPEVEAMFDKALPASVPQSN